MPSFLKDISDGARRIMAGAFKNGANITIQYPILFMYFDFARAKKCDPHSNHA